MPDAKLAGPVLLLAGSTVLLGSLAPSLHLEQGSQVGLALMGVGLITAAIAWRKDMAVNLIPASYLRRRNSSAPAKHLKIRIRCAR